jgi:putative membrane protein
MNIILRLIVLIISIGVTAYLLPGVLITGVAAAVIAGLILAIVNTFLRPILIILTLPINILTLGLFTFVINALLVMLAAWIVPGFMVLNFGWALLFSIVVAVINAFLGLALADAERKDRVRTGR